MITQKNILLAIIAMLILSACGSLERPSACEPPQIQREFGGCCPDTNNDGLCDLEKKTPTEPEEQHNITETINQNTDETQGDDSNTELDNHEQNNTQNDTEEMKENPNTENSNDSSEKSTQIEKFEAAYQDNVNTVSYFIDSPYGLLWVWIDQEKTAYISAEKLFTNNQGIVEKSQLHYQNSRAAFINQVEDRVLPAMNYIEHKGNTYTGCYVQETFYSLDNCIGDYPNRNPIIHYNLRFQDLKLAQEWMPELNELTPTEIREGHYLRDTNGNSHKVNILIYDSSQSSNQISRAYIHAKYGVPLRIELNSGKIYTYDEPRFNEILVGEGPRLPAGYRE